MLSCNLTHTPKFIAWYIAKEHTAWRTTISIVGEVAYIRRYFRRGKFNAFDWYTKGIEGENVLKNDEGRILDDESGGRGDKMKDESPRIAGITRRFWAHEFYVSRQSWESMEFVLKRYLWYMRYVEDYLTQNNRIYFYLTPIWGIYRICLINIYVIHVIRQLCEFCVKLRRFHRFAFYVTDQTFSNIFFN